MKAVVFTKYGGPEVLRLAEIAAPVPKDSEVLVRVRAASVNFGDLLARRFNSVSPRDFSMNALFWIFAKIYFGISKPRVTVLGSEFSGVIDSVGKDVKRFSPGDRVFGYRGQNMGSYAEYLCVPETGVLAVMPDNMSFEEAAASPYGAMMALSLLRKADILPGQKVLINGASGGIGSAAVQIAKHLGAEVTGVCGTPRIDYVKKLGADKVIDYSKEDFTRSGECYDLIFDILGKTSFSQCKRSLTPNGKYLLASFKVKQLLQMMKTSLTSGRKVICALAPGSLEDLLSVKELIEAGKIKPVIDRAFPLARAAEAHAYAESGAKKGSVVLAVSTGERNE